MMTMILIIIMMIIIIIDIITIIDVIDTDVNISNGDNDNDAKDNVIDIHQTILNDDDVDGDATTNNIHVALAATRWPTRLS